MVAHSFRVSANKVGVKTFGAKSTRTDCFLITLPRVRVFKFTTPFVTSVLRLKGAIKINCKHAACWQEWHQLHFSSQDHKTLAFTKCHKLYYTRLAWPSQMSWFEKSQNIVYSWFKKLLLVQCRVRRNCRLMFFVCFLRLMREWRRRLFPINRPAALALISTAPFLLCDPRAHMHTCGNNNNEASGCTRERDFLTKMQNAPSIYPEAPGNFHYDDLVSGDDMHGQCDICMNMFSLNAAHYCISTTFVEKHSPGENNYEFSQ